MMKTKYFSLIFLIISLFGCASTGKLNTSDPNLKAIESKKSLDLPDACKKYSFFTENVGGDYWPSPNEAIAEKLENLVESSVASFVSSSSENSSLSSLSDSSAFSGQNKLFSSKSAVFSYLKTNYDVYFSPSKSSYENFLILKTDGSLFYITSNYSYSFYAFKLSIDQAELQNYTKLTSSYSRISSSIKNNENLISTYSNPNVERTRQVPYTAYRQVQKRRTVTKYRTVTTSSGSYQEPYTDYETYYESEPYTAYRSESYLAPNPDYNPTRAAEIEKDNSALRSELADLKSEINLCDYFTLDWN